MGGIPGAPVLDFLDNAKQLPRRDFCNGAAAQIGENIIFKPGIDPFPVCLRF